MERTGLIPAADFCTHNHISFTVISHLQEAGLIEIVTVEETTFLHEEQLRDIEKLIAFHTELDINMEGIEVIARLLSQMENMKQEMKMLERRLGLYE